MKSLLVLALAMMTTLTTTAAWATTTYETGMGNQIGYCSYSQGPFCVSNIQRRAEYDAQREATVRCQSKRGQARTFTAQCNSICFPDRLNPGEQNRLVNCRSTCSLQCDIPN